MSADNAPQDGEKQNDVSKKVPWDDDSFNAEVAKRLVLNLRSDKEGLQEKNRGLSAQLETLTAKVSQVDALVAKIEQLHGELAASQKAEAETKAQMAKEALLTDRGLPRDLLPALAGESEEEWVKMADLLATLQGSTPRNAWKNPLQDGVQDEKSGGQDAQKIALARAIFGDD